MRWTRLFLLGFASIYPLYWMTQFVLFFLPAVLRALLLRLPLTVVNISYLQATATAGKSDALPSGTESLFFAILFSSVIWYLRGDKFLTGGLAIVLLGQSALLPFLNQFLWLSRVQPFPVLAAIAALSLICFGLHRILARTGGRDFVDRLALLSLLAVLPQAALWLAFRIHYPFFGTRFLLMLLAPLYLGALIVSGLPHKLNRGSAGTMRTPVPLIEILASLVVACLLFIAIGLSTRPGEPQHTIATSNAHLERFF